MLNESEKGRTTCLINDIIIILYYLYFGNICSLARRLVTVAVASLLIILYDDRGGSVGLLDYLGLTLQPAIMAHALHHVRR